MTFAMRALLFWIVLTIAGTTEAKADSHFPEFAAGGLVFHEAVDISIARQDLSISP